MRREFPESSDKIQVFVDQLPGTMSEERMRFVAEHYVGTQKMLPEQVDAIRRYNPNFIMLHYRLGLRQLESKGKHIHNGRWGNDWHEIGKHKNWFVRNQAGKAVYQLTPKGLKEFIMDISGRYNDTEGRGWKEYWARTMMAEAAASHADGVFADSVRTPIRVPDEFDNSPLGIQPMRGYLPHLETWLDYVYQQLNQERRYFILNLSGLCTKWDTTQGYYEHCHGFMSEGIGIKTDDWELWAERTLKLLRNGKIWLAQQKVKRTDYDSRMWYFANFLLLKTNNGLGLHKRV